MAPLQADLITSRATKESQTVMWKKIVLVVLAALLAAYGVASIVAINMAKAGTSSNMLSQIVGDFEALKRFVIAGRHDLWLLRVDRFRVRVVGA